MAIKASDSITLSSVTDIESVWWYYKLQSSTLNPPAKPTTNPPSSDWTLTEPTYTAGSTNTLYFVELTVFSDGTFDYGNVSVDSSYEAAKAAYNKAQAVEQRVTVAETAIEQTQEAITLRATKEEVEAANDQIEILDADISSALADIGALNGEVTELAQQMITSDGIKNIVFESSQYKSIASIVEQNSQGLQVLRETTVTGIEGRLDTIEEYVRISGSNVDIGRSDSDTQLHLDNEGWAVTEVGQETIWARDNRVVAPRFQTDIIIIGSLAFVSSDGDLSLLKYGG